MTSVDSGVDTGNDSNDSGQAEGQLLFAPPSTNSVKRGRIVEVKRNPEDNGKQLEIVETSNEQTTTPTTILCLTQNSSPLSLHFVRNGDAPGGALALERTLEFCLPEPVLRADSKWLCKNNVKEQLGSIKFHSEHLGDIGFHSHKLCNKSGRAYTRSERACSTRERRQAGDPFQRSMWEKRMRLAAATNNVELITSLLEKGVSPNNADAQGRSPLHLACSSGYTDIVKLLLDYGADPNRTDTLGNTPLHLAAVTSKTSVVVLLLKAGTNVLSFDRHGYNPLQLAQTKLRMLQNSKSSEISQVKEEVHKVVEMLLAYLQQQKDVGVQIEALSSFCSRLSLSNTTDQVQDDVKDLLASIDSLSLSNN
ncbi:ankyrin repeat domain-containing protein 54 [Diachasma alloeum]|uniref:ankyrin repeat domain-containing protein 54 n=1 Tax=Diachasma alloeum TaxID=454923 RepID=UPI0007381D99|nr:ankyrin repeat domain-containing protein 54 [Diachasma alloeum]XP_015108410.1 ankyrin repeat domain-containing protein 54 [Diachasma alloeum]